MKVDSRTVPANGAELYCEVRGAGRAVLFISGATGDGGHFEKVAEALADEYKIITYDRRGNSRSANPAGWTETSIEEQADDAAGLVEALGLAPVVLVGTSGGGSIGVELLLRRPELVSAAIIHEPMIMNPLHEQDAEVLSQMYAAVEAAIASGGPRAGVDLFVAGAAGNTTWQQGIDPALRERMLGNGETLFGIDFPAFAGYRPAGNALTAIKVPVQVLRSRESALPFMAPICAWLASLLGVEVATLPGSHTAYLDLPGEWAAALRSHLAQAVSP